jgi:hypothetical protein
LRDYETLYGKAATDDAIMQLTNGIEKEHKKQKQDRQHEELMASSWGPASVSAGMSDGPSMNNSFSNGSALSPTPNIPVWTHRCQWCQRIRRKKTEEC